jgi:hypothetical protein
VCKHCNVMVAQERISSEVPETPHSRRRKVTDQQLWRQDRREWWNIHCHVMAMRGHPVPEYGDGMVHAGLG